MATAQAKANETTGACNPLDFIPHSCSRHITCKAPGNISCSRIEDFVADFQPLAVED